MSGTRATALPEPWQRLLTNGMEAARTQTSSVVSTLARELAPMVGDARKRVEPLVGMAGDQVSPLVARLAPSVEHAWRVAEPQLAGARRELVTSVVPTVTKAVEDAYVASGPLRAEMLRRGEAAWEVLREGEVSGRRSGGRWSVALGLLAAGAALGAAVDRMVNPSGPAGQ